jgi:hypothetical protein
MCERFCTCQKDCTYIKLLYASTRVCFPHTDETVIPEEARRTTGEPELELEARAEKMEDVSTETTPPDAITTTVAATDLVSVSPLPVSENTTASNATANGLLSEYYLWCGSASLTRLCAELPYEYTCDMDSGRMNFAVRDWNCHNSCRCIGECQWRDIVYSLNVPCARDDGPPGMGVGRTMAEIEAEPTTADFAGDGED